MTRKAENITPEKQNEQAPEKPPRYYKQKKPNDQVRKEAALKYIEDKKRPRKKPGNFPASDAALDVKPGDNSKFVYFGMKIFNMTPIDLCNAEQVEARINEYFQLCYELDMKPGVANLAMALGIDRTRLVEIRKDADRSNLPAPCRHFIKKAYNYMETYWESIMQNGKINPASGIFLGKNNFGYKDQTETILTPNTRMIDQAAPEDLQKRIEALPED